MYISQSAAVFLSGVYSLHRNTCNLGKLVIQWALLNAPLVSVSAESYLNSMNMKYGLRDNIKGTGGWLHHSATREHKANYTI